MVGINISNLKKSFGENVAVDIEHFEIHKGDMLGLVGNNGAGKTTLFRLLLDLLEADEGEIEMLHSSPSLSSGEGQSEAPINPAKSEEWKQFTGAYIDEAFLIEFLTPEEYFQFVAQANGMTQEETDERLKPFEHFMQGEILGQKKLIRDLSAGNKQKVGIISTMLSRPDLIILDEPFNFLDPSSQNVLKHVLTDYNKETGATILVSSHNLAHTIDISNRIALLEKGHIVRDLANENASAKAELENYFETE